MTFKTSGTENLIELIVEPVMERYYSDESSYGIYLCNDLRDKLLKVVGWEKNLSTKVTIVGNMPRLTLYRKYTVKGEKKVHPKFGEQYQVHSVVSNEVDSKIIEQDFLRFLVTDNQFNEITRYYPFPVTAIMDNTFDVSKIKRFNQKSLDNLKIKIEENRNNMKAMSVLGQYGISFNKIKKIVEQYGNADMAIQMIFDNPYILYRDIDGIGFIRADQIAQAIGFDFNSPKRIQAGIMYAIELEENIGNTWGFISEVKIKAEEVLKLTIENIDEVLEQDIFYVDKENDKIALMKTWQCESDIRDEINRINDYQDYPLFPEEELAKKIAKIEENLDIQYTDEQKQLFYKININQIVVLSGAAGTGKSTLLRGCLNLIDERCLSYTIMSPTAKGAKVAERITGRQASTIHRGLGWKPCGFEINSENPFTEDLIVVDETSLVDIYLFRSLLRAITQGTKVILIGDHFQLESIQAGNILQDLIESEKFAVVKLETVFRQKEFSGILDVATSTRSGIPFFNSKDEILELGEKKDFKFWAGEKEDTARRVMMVYQQLLKNYDAKDIVAISPIKKGMSGVKLLNDLMQEFYNSDSVNPDKIELKRCSFKKGDIIVNIKNDYQVEHLDDFGNPTGEVGIFNGDTGVVKEIDVKNKYVYADFGDKIIRYSGDSLNCLELGYCLTAHRMQGDSRKYIILAMDWSHFMNLKRSLLYTAVTRASEKLFIVGEKRAISYAIKNNSIIKKRTFLKEMLLEK